MKKVSQQIPRFSVASLLMVMACCAIGLTVGTGSPQQNDDVAQLGFYVPQLNWHYALLGMASGLVILELWCQQRQLRLYPPEAPAETLRYGWQWARSARSVVAMCLTILLGFVALVQHRVVVLAEHREINLFLTEHVFPHLTLQATFFFALAVART